MGMLLWVLWVFLRWRVCRATMAGSWLLRHRCKDSQISTRINRLNRLLFAKRCKALSRLLTAIGRASAGCCSVWGSAGEPGVSSGAAGCPACCRSGPDTAGLSGWWTAGWGWSRCRCGSGLAPACSCCSPGPWESPTADCNSSPKMKANKVKDLKNWAIV